MFSYFLIMLRRMLKGLLVLLLLYMFFIARRRMSLTREDTLPEKLARATEIRSNLGADSPCRSAMPILCPSTLAMPSTATQRIGFVVILSSRTFSVNLSFRTIFWHIPSLLGLSATSSLLADANSLRRRVLTLHAYHCNCTLTVRGLLAFCIKKLRWMYLFSENSSVPVPSLADSIPQTYLLIIISVPARFSKLRTHHEVGNSDCGLLWYA